jgi:hypothetical protein
MRQDSWRAIQRSECGVQTALSKRLPQGVDISSRMYRRKRLGLQRLRRWNGAAALIGC